MSVAISSAAIAASSSASVAAANARRRADEAKCETVLNNYNAETASVKDMKGYSACVEMLHPTPNEPMGDTGVLFVKFGILLLIAAFVVGVIKGFREYRDFGMALLEGVVYILILALVVFVSFLIVAGVAFIIAG